MGVTALWSVLDPIKKHRSLSSLRGQMLAVDLSIWICENQSVRRMQNSVLKPHLRNLFFRISNLLQNGVKLVFVIDGEAPALKHMTMAARIQARNKGTACVSSKGNFCRNNLKSLLRECCELLDCLGVPYLQAQGEAESLCAALNVAGIVDACITDDGDCFLYGARIVYKNFTLDVKDPHVESYNLEDITSDLHLTRENLVALGLLLGCDYYPSGVPGIGETWAVKLMTSLAGVDVLDRFKQWKQMGASDCIDKIEQFVWRKASSLTDFPPQKVLDEFLKLKEILPETSPQWNRPHLLKFMTFGAQYLQWPEKYSVEKILPLMTLWDQLDTMGKSVSAHFQPKRILKRRVRNKVPYFEVEWDNQIKELVDETGHPRILVTLEEETRFHICFPEVVESFIQASKDLKATKSKKMARVKTDEAALAAQIGALTINSHSSKDRSMVQALTVPHDSVKHHKAEKYFSQAQSPAFDLDHAHSHLTERVCQESLSTAVTSTHVLDDKKHAHDKDTNTKIFQASCAPSTKTGHVNVKKTGMKEDFFNSCIHVPSVPPNMLVLQAPSYASEVQEISINKPDSISSSSASTKKQLKNKKISNPHKKKMFASNRVAKTIPRYLLENWSDDEIAQSDGKPCSHLTGDVDVSTCKRNTGINRSQDESKLSFECTVGNPHFILQHSLFNSMNDSDQSSELFGNSPELSLVPKSRAQFETQTESQSTRQSWACGSIHCSSSQNRPLSLGEELYLHEDESQKTVRELPFLCRKSSHESEVCKCSVVPRESVQLVEDSLADGDKSSQADEQLPSDITDFMLQLDPNKNFQCDFLLPLSQRLQLKRNNFQNC